MTLYFDGDTHTDNSSHFYIKRDGWPLTPIVGYCPGVTPPCPTCNSQKICIFFKAGFVGKNQSKWEEIMTPDNFELCNDYEIIMKSNFHPNWICKDCYDGGVVLEITKNLLDEFKKSEKNFTQKSKPIMWNENCKKLSMKEIHAKESNGDSPVSMIAVTRHQYDIDNFPKYVNYIKNMLQKSRIYYGLWSDGKKIEYDVLYVIPTDDYKEIQKHLNAHDHLNNGVTQRMALVISKDGTTKIRENNFISRN